MAPVMGEIMIGCCSECWCGVCSSGECSSQSVASTALMQCDASQLYGQAEPAANGHKSIIQM